MPIILEVYKPEKDIRSYNHPLIVNHKNWLGRGVNQGPWICGGAARKICYGEELDTDIDIYFQSEEQYHNFKLKLLHEAKFKAQSTWAETWVWAGIEVQLIKFTFYENLNAVLDDFDITVCQFGFDGEYIFAPTHSKDHIRTKKLIFHKINKPKHAMRRIIKYTKAGFDLHDKDVLKFFKAIVAASSLKGVDDPSSFDRVPSASELVWIGKMSDYELTKLLESLGIVPARLCLCTSSYSSDLEVEFKSIADKNLFILMKDRPIKGDYDEIPF